MKKRRRLNRLIGTRFRVAELYSPDRLGFYGRELGYRSVGAYDIKCRAKDGSTCDLLKDNVKLSVSRELSESDPDWLLGSPPCSAFSSLENLNDRNTAAAVRRLEVGIEHLQFACKEYLKIVRSGLPPKSESCPPSFGR